MTRVCEEYGGGGDKCRSKEKVQAFAVKFDADPTKDKKSVVHKHMKLCQSRDLEEAVDIWYAQQKSVNVLGDEILDAANKLAESLGITFKSSTLSCVDSVIDMVFVIKWYKF